MSAGRGVRVPKCHEPKSRWYRPELDSLELDERIVIEASGPFIRLFDYVVLLIATAFRKIYVAWNKVKIGLHLQFDTVDGFDSSRLRFERRRQRSSNILIRAI
jgi:hypothetical protein